MLISRHVQSHDDSNANVDVNDEKTSNCEREMTMTDDDVVVVDLTL